MPVSDILRSMISTAAPLLGPVALGAPLQHASASTDADSPAPLSATGPVVLTGTLRNDQIVGGEEDSEITALAGNDAVFGGGGRDVIDAGNGDDVVLAGAGADVILDGSGNDLIRGGSEADLFVLGDGTNRILDFEAGLDQILIANFDLSVVDVFAVEGNAVIAFSEGETTVEGASVDEVRAALVAQQSGFVQINEDGWGDRQELYAWSQAVYDGYLYVSTLNLDGTQPNAEITGAGGLYRYHGASETWETISKDGLGNLDNDGIRNLLEFDGALYAGTLNATDGAELLRSEDGVTFTPVITGGFGRSELGSIRALYAFEDAIYVGFQSLDDSPLMLLRSEDGVTFDEVSLPGMRRPNYANNDSLHALTEFDGFLYAGTRNPTTGFELYRSDDGLDWEMVVGPRGPNEGGITGNNNTLVYHMIEFKDALYVGTGNFREGFAVYRSFDGVSFEQVDENGFGNSGNNFAWRFHVFEDQLYLGTNYDAPGYGGGSLFRTDDGETWESLVGEDGAYDLAGFNDVRNWGVRSFATYEDELYIGTANYPYFDEGLEDAMGAQIFKFLGDPPADTPDYLY